MKKQKLIFLLLSCLFVAYSFSQTVQQSDSSLGVYPLHVGNLWQYWTYDFLNGQTTWTYGWTERVDRDTLMPNGKTYSIIVSDGSTGGIRRQLGTKVVSYFNQDSDMVRYDFSKTVGDTIWFLKAGMDTLFCSIWADDFTSLFGQMVRQQVYYIKTRRSSEGTKYFLADGYGIAKILYEPGEEWFLRGAIINGIIYGTITSVQNNKGEVIPIDFKLLPNYPNPFNAGTIISFQTNSTRDINLSIYDLLGRKTKTLINQEISSGTHRLFWNGRNEKGDELSSGIYICRLQSSSYSFQRKMLMLK